MQPGFYAENLLMLAKASAKLKRVEEAAEWRRKVFCFSTQTTHFSHMSHTPFPHISDLNSFFFQVPRCRRDVSGGLALKGGVPQLQDLGAQKRSAAKVRDVTYSSYMMTSELQGVKHSHTA